MMIKHIVRIVDLSLKEKNSLQRVCQAIEEDGDYIIAKHGAAQSKTCAICAKERTF